MDITGDSDDLEEEAAGTHDDDYSSYELDDSDTAAMGVYYHLIAIFLFSGLRGVHVNRPGSSRPRSLRTDTYSFCTWYDQKMWYQIAAVFPSWKWGWREFCFSNTPCSDQWLYGLCTVRLIFLSVFVRFVLFRCWQRKWKCKRVTTNNKCYSRADRRTPLCKVSCVSSRMHDEARFLVMVHVKHFLTILRQSIMG